MTALKMTARDGTTISNFFVSSSNVNFNKNDILSASVPQVSSISSESPSLSHGPGRVTIQVLTLCRLQWHWHPLKLRLQVQVQVAT